MGTKTSIAALVAALLLVLVVGGAYAYDSSKKDQIADGVTIAGVDVGGLNEAEAATKVRRKLLTPLRHSLKVGFDGQTWKLSGARLKIRADVDSAVEEAIEDSQEGGLPGRLVRYVSGAEVDEAITPQVAYSDPAVNRFVRHVAEEINREPKNADVEATGDSLKVVAGEGGAQAARQPAREGPEGRGAERQCPAHDQGAGPRDPAGSDQEGSGRGVPVLPDPRPLRPSPCVSGST